MSPNSHLRVHNVHTLGLPPPIIPCLVAGCNRRFYNRAGRSNHVRSQHPDFLWLHIPLASGSSPHNPSTSQSTSSNSPSPDPIHRHPRSPSIEVEEDEDDGGDGDIDMMFDPVGAPSLDNESDDGRLRYKSTAGSSRGTSPRNSDDGARGGVVPPGINRLYHSNINGELFIFIGVSYVY